MLIKITGCGFSEEMELGGDSSVEGIVSYVAQVLKVGPQHIKLLFRGKLLCGSMSLSEFGIKDRTRLLVMHTAIYHREKEALDKLTDLRRQAEQIDQSTPNAEELYTQLLCKLDAVDVSSSDWLRAQRKEQIAAIHSRSSHNFSSSHPHADGD